MVYDLSDRRSLFELRDGLKRPPASVEKLYTSVAVLRKLGPGARLRTSVLGLGHLGPGGVWHGSLYLKGGGDPTFGDGTFNRIWEQGYGPTAAQLASQLRARGIHRVTGPLIGDASLFSGRPGGPASAFAPDIPDFGGELSALTFDHGSTSGPLTAGAFAARQLARTLRAEQVRVKATPRVGIAPRRAHRLASVTSPPMSVLLKLMDVPSDDLFAEMLTMQLGRRFGGNGTIAAGARVISGVTNSYDVHPRIVDGSGLSREDASSPAEVVALLRALWHTPIGRDAHGVVAGRRRQRHRPDDRRQDPGTGTMLRQDRDAQRRHEPRRLLRRPRQSEPCVRAFHRRAPQLVGTDDARPDGLGDRLVLELG